MSTIRLSRALRLFSRRGRTIPFSRLPASTRFPASSVSVFLSTVFSSLQCPLLFFPRPYLLCTSGDRAFWFSHRPPLAHSYTSALIFPFSFSLSAPIFVINIRPVHSYLLMPFPHHCIFSLHVFRYFPRSQRCQELCRHRWVPTVDEPQFRSATRLPLEQDLHEWVCQKR